MRDLLVLSGEYTLELFVVASRAQCVAIYRRFVGRCGFDRPRVVSRASCGSGAVDRDCNGDLRGHAALFCHAPSLDVSLARGGAHSAHVAIVGVWRLPELI